MPKGKAVVRASIPEFHLGSEQPTDSNQKAKIWLQVPLNLSGTKRVRITITGGEDLTQEDLDFIIGLINIAKKELPTDRQHQDRLLPQQAEPLPSPNSDTPYSEPQE